MSAPHSASPNVTVTLPDGKAMTLARGGVYVAGGIAVKVLPKLKDGRFVAAARDKEKMKDFLAAVPIYVVLNEECPLLGAAYVAWKGL